VVPTDKPGVFNHTKYEAAGVVACIMPWNSPLPLTSLKLAPALAAGCTVVLKPSEFTSASLLEFAKLVEAAGFPPGVVNVVAGIFAASGQTCVAGSRLLVQETIRDSFLERLRALVADVRFDHPADPATQIAPISTAPQMEKIRAYVDIARREGARLVAGGEPASVPGYPNGLFYRPTIFADVRNDMRIAQEEVFGPVLAVIRFRDEDDAVRIANDTQFGLAADVWTQSMRRALAMADRVRAGTVWVNNYRSTSTTLPFGGFKMSGIGREGGIAGIREYMEVKSVWISTALEIPNPFIRR